MASRNLWKAAKRIGGRAEPPHAPMRSRPAVMGLCALGLLAAAAVALPTNAANAQSNSGSGNSGSGFSVGFDAIQLDSAGGGGGGGKGDGGKSRFGGGGFGGSDPKNHGMNFGDVRERCLADDAFRRRNSTTCARLLD